MTLSSPGIFFIFLFLNIVQAVFHGYMRQIKDEKKMQRREREGLRDESVEMNSVLLGEVFKGVSSHANTNMHVEGQKI